MTESTSEANSTNDLNMSAASDQENFGTLKDTVVDTVANHLPSVASDSDFSFSVQSCTDLSSLVDHCLSDSVTAEMSMMNSPRQIESADDNDIHSVLSTPPLHPDSDNDITLPANEHYANGVFPDIIDNQFVSESCSSDQLPLNSLIDVCTKVVNNYSTEDADVISKQLDMDVDSLLCVNDNDAQQNEERTVSARSDDDDHFNCDTHLSNASNSLKDITGDVKNDNNDSVEDRDVISKRLDMDVDSLLNINDDAEKNEGTEQSHQHAASATSDVGGHFDCDTDLSDVIDADGDVKNDNNDSMEDRDVISKQLDMDVDSLLNINDNAEKNEGKEQSHQHTASATSDVGGHFNCDAHLSNASDSLKDVTSDVKNDNNDSMEDTDVISKQLDMEVDSLLTVDDDAQKNEGKGQSCQQTVSQSARSDDGSHCDTGLSDAVDSLSDVISDVKKEATDSQNADAHGNQSCDAVLPVEPFPQFLQGCSTEQSSDGDKDLADSQPFIAEYEETVASECEPELPAGGSTVKDVDTLCDIGNVTTKYVDEDELCDDGSKTVANFVTILPSPSAQESSVQLLPDSKENVASGLKLYPEWAVLSDGSCVKEVLVKTETDDHKLSSTSSISGSADNTISSASVCNAYTINKELASQLEAKDTLPMPCVSSFWSSSSDRQSFGETWLPDWKLQTNAVVKIKRLDLPATRYFPASKNTTGRNEGEGVASSMPLSSGQSSSPSKLALVQPVLSKMTLDEESKPQAMELSTKAASGLSDRSAMSSEVAELSSESKTQATKLPTKAAPGLSVGSAVSSVVADLTSESKTQATKLPTKAVPGLSVGSAVSSVVADLTSESKSHATKLPTKAVPALLDRSAVSSVVADLSSDQLKQGKHTGNSKVPSPSFVTNVTASLSSSGSKQSSSPIVAGAPVQQQKRFSYLDYCNSPRYQPVVRLFRLPLEFFRMLQQTPLPSASSSVSVSDLTKRLVNLKTCFSCTPSVYLTC